MCNIPFLTSNLINCDRPSVLQPQSIPQYKNRKRTKLKYALRPRKIMYALLLAVLQSNPNHQVYALLGTNHAIINEPSKDIAQQCAYIDTIINNMTNQQHQGNECITY